MLDIVVIILLILTMLALFVGTVILIISLFQDFDFGMFLMAIFMVVLCLIPIGMGYDYYQKETAQQEIVISDVEVMAKKYHPATTRIMIAGKTTRIIPVAAKYLTTIQSDKHSQTIDNRSIYDTFEVGDRFQMNLILYRNKDGKVFTKEFKFIE